ncbi:hypothetical protein H828_YJM1478D00748 [Saccharomyces cerevisiae YJM1478]|uniref:Uncharacterized protein YDR524W-C n=6 Tax=Saccharomyces cerevisiae TaxID=4932 RepID=YD24C_YEAST|nr:uncharacterized protein YDR524W-C [Saccharomyces cerevisiae S288C]P0C1Z1.1 RecName: Full=Uncharacterized protein YDR524W-C [Saccharomyces cerevisiae S288C]pir/S78714/ protein YDR524w-a - yeast (Saccharomyces cerevisiae) [Saccharomyces cerevisiae]AHY75468.1 hypothetical protein H779_YJM993D00731 [Saccharomyces cerevisiae YJM993]AJU58316.1 hypothetical protein H747_YJM189D00728 [Saccharomyces cerevisiae YJM189]AJU59006.1 hypothetical protein H748_YJM193D00726 [Saccharomyces cerevisiae YJM193]|eukprot:NP_878066.3 hypothetical protein YDR524W-C [Saccharomyces cerevisiae S288C]
MKRSYKTLPTYFFSFFGPFKERAVFLLVL